ncbi:MAG: secretin N-terminal domain-containing protein, partial [Myxococcota bacterium]
MWWMLAWAVSVAWGADDDRGIVLERPGDGSVQIQVDRQRPSGIEDARQLVLDFGDTNLFDLSLYFADLMRKNLLVTNEEELRKRTVRLVGHEAMTVDEAWQAFLVTLRGNGFTVDESANLVRIVPTKDGARGKVAIGEGAPEGHEGLVTRILPLSNAQAGDVVSIVTPLLSPEAVVVAYAPGNRLIVTDTGANVAKIAELVEGIDWAAPRSTVQRTQLRYADVEEVRTILLALYPVETQAPTTPNRRATRRDRTNRRGRTRDRAAAPATPTTATTGQPSRHIEQILSDPRTNSLIVLANPSGHTAVAEILTDLD